MNKEMVEYTDNPEIGELVVVEDILPSPEELAQADELVKVTISLSKTSVDFFKEAAEETNSSYQRMIRRLLDEYVARMQKTDRNARR